jgi:hypothetical protein
VVSSPPPFLPFFFGFKNSSRGIWDLPKRSKEIEREREREREKGDIRTEK